MRREAAIACLRVAEPEAIASWESVARGGIFGEGFAARQAIAGWRKDGIVVDGAWERRGRCIAMAAMRETHRKLQISSLKLRHFGINFENAQVCRKFAPG